MPLARLPAQMMKFGDLAAIPRTITKDEMLVFSGATVTELLMTVLPPVQRGEESRGSDRPAHGYMNTLIVSHLQPIAFTHLRVKVLPTSIKVLYPPLAWETCDERKQSTRSIAMRSTG